MFNMFFGGGGGGMGGGGMRFEFGGGGGGGGFPGEALEALRPPGPVRARDAACSGSGRGSPHLRKRDTARPRPAVPAGGFHGGMGGHGGGGGGGGGGQSLYSGDDAVAELDDDTFPSGDSDWVWLVGCGAGTAPAFRDAAG
jgi:hypothetical protein